MSISAGHRLGAYEVLSPLGAGGMGEVWRARDTRLARDVAIKVLPAELSADPTRLRRFEREAQAASALTHPNIVTIFEVAAADGASYIAMELVEGKTLRELMAGAAMPMRRLLAVAPQIAEGLARAHEAGIVHRDLKPENVMVTKDGLVKILDFGLAKLSHPEQDSGQTESAMTVSAVTRPGLAMGTAAYMSPEQASGHPVDFRSDQFAFGSMLYEMATGRPAFRRPTAAQTLAAIIEDEPEPMSPGAPAPLRWIVARCMAKEPENRYAATRDLVRDLSTLRDHVSELSSSTAIAIEEPRRRPRWRAIAFAVAGAAALAGMLFLGRRLERAGMSEPSYRQLTYRGAGIGSARFAPDGQTIVFSSQTEGRPPELFSLRLDSAEARPMGLPPAHVLSISATGHMALLLLRPFALLPRIGHLGFEQVFYRDPSLLDGTLGVAPVAGGAPSEILEDVLYADWTGANDDLAVIHRAGNQYRVELPIGTTLYDREEIILNNVRMEKAGGRLAFKDWGDVFWTDAKGSVARTGPWEGFDIAWSDATGELWYTVARAAETEIHAVGSGGRDRLVATLPGSYVLYDISKGRVLLGRLVEETEILGSFPDEPRERNLSYFDLSAAIDLSADGQWLLFRDTFLYGTHLGEPGGAYLRRTDGSAPRAVRGGAYAISPDGRFVVGEGAGSDTGKPTPLTVWPTGAGTGKDLATGMLNFDWIEGRIGFFPDGKRVWFSGNQLHEPRRVWVQDLDGGPPRAVSPEHTSRPVLTGDGRFLCARGPDFVWRLYPSDGKGEAAAVAGLLPGEEPIRATPDGKWLYVRGADELRLGESIMTTRVYRLDPHSGQRELWKEIPPASPRSGGAISTILFSEDGKTCVWTHMRYTTELVLAEGLK